MFSQEYILKMTDINVTMGRNELGHNKTFRSLVPDVVHIAHLQEVLAQQKSSPISEMNSDNIESDEEFFLAKNSKLFSQVSTNMLTTVKSKNIPISNTEDNPFYVVAIKESEIVKSVASINIQQCVVLPNISVHMSDKPLIVERVEIIEDNDIEIDPINLEPDNIENKNVTRVDDIESASRKRRECLLNKVTFGSSENFINHFPLFILNNF